MWLECLWLIPKNLVYVFVFAILFAFLAMVYITYTDAQITDIMAYDRSDVTVVVDPLFVSLQEAMNLRVEPWVRQVQVEDFNVKRFNMEYLRINRPVHVKKMCAEWGSTQNWSIDYLSDKAEDMQILYSMLPKNDDVESWSFAKHAPMRMSGTIKEALESITMNGQEGNSPAHVGTKAKKWLYFIDDEVIRGSKLRDDYEFPYLHKFMRLRSSTLSVWPEEITHVRPRQDKGEQFMCLIDGSVSIKMISSIFAQNMYQGVFEDLNPIDVPEDISLMGLNFDKYPLLYEVKDYIQGAKLEKGDCIYIPNFYFF